MAGRWGDRVVLPHYTPESELINIREWLDRQPVDLEAVKRRLRSEGVLGTLTTANGVEVNGPPGLMAALADVKPLPWKWIGFGALVAGLALWSWLA